MGKLFSAGRHQACVQAYWTCGSVSISRPAWKIPAAPLSVSLLPPLSGKCFVFYLISLFEWLTPTLEHVERISQQETAGKENGWFLNPVSLQFRFSCRLEPLTPHSRASVFSVIELLILMQVHRRTELGNDDEFVRWRGMIVVYYCLSVAWLLIC